MRITRIVTVMTITMAVWQGFACFEGKAQEPDKPFLQAESVKYPVVEDIGNAVLRKTVTDYNGVAYVLSDKGVLMACEGKLVRDMRYRPLTEKVPADICTQEGSGHLYYLYDDHFLTNGHAGVPYGQFPGSTYSLIAVSKDGTVLLAGSSAIAVYKDSTITGITTAAGKISKIAADNETFFLLSDDGLLRLKDHQLTMLHRGKALQTFAIFPDRIMIGGTEGFYGISKTSGDTIVSMQTQLPDPRITALRNVNGKLWAATEGGAFMEEKKGSYRFYSSKRWLDDNTLRDVSAGNSRQVYFLSSKALNEIRFVPQTLSAKTVLFQDDIRKRHIRYGFISNVSFTKPGDRSTSQLTDTDNDGLWSAFYLGSQAFRYAVTREPEAKRYAWEAFEAFERIISVNPIKGFPARTFERKGFKYSDPDRWHDSPQKEWEWKGTTSSDEFVAYIWVAAVLNEFVAQSADEKKRVVRFIDQILTHIIDHNYTLVDADGQPTLWGRWNPEYINSFPKTVGDRRLGSTTIIAGLQLAYALTKKERYKKEAFTLMNKHGYLENMLLPYSSIQPTKGVMHLGVDLGNGGWNHSDDEMAFLTYWVLHKYAFTKDLASKYAVAILDHWKIEKPEKNSVWNLVTLTTTGTYDKEATLWQLREFPTDLVRWDVKNSGRKDLVFLPPNFRNQTTSVLLPPGEAPMHRHNANAFELDGGERGMTELAGDEYLLPYWMARYLNVIR